jgi:hypothetical protein
MRNQLKPSVRKARLEADDKMRKTTRLLVASGRQMGKPDDEIRTMVKEAIMEALDGNKPWTQDVTWPGRDEPEPCLSSAGLFRMAIEYFDLDRSNQYDQEHWHYIVMSELEATLLRDDGDFRRRKPGAA